MNHNLLLTVTSLLSVVLMTLHLSDDIARGISPPGADNIGAVAILLVWSFGTLVVGNRIGGIIIMLLGALFTMAMPVIHMTGRGYPQIASSSGGLFFISTLLSLGTTGGLAFILSAGELWGRWRSRQRAEKKPSGTL
jgi:hypothetical protein